MGLAGGLRHLVGALRWLPRTSPGRHGRVLARRCGQGHWTRLAAGATRETLRTRGGSGAQPQARTASEPCTTTTSASASANQAKCHGNAARKAVPHPRTSRSAPRCQGSRGCCCCGHRGRLGGPDPSARPRRSARDARITSWASRRQRSQRPAAPMARDKQHPAGSKSTPPTTPSGRRDTIAAAASVFRGRSHGNHVAGRSVVLRLRRSRRHSR
mmetsp:Transcript_45230/g.106742  ORF Transcript_45230/g.106742 Transcript_45230/m.106742 type:complete len:214 (-) Transcript_45230:478-1119(-)